MRLSAESVAPILFSVVLLLLIMGTSVETASNSISSARPVSLVDMAYTTPTPARLTGSGDYVRSQQCIHMCENFCHDNRLVAVGTVGGKVVEELLL